MRNPPSPCTVLLGHPGHELLIHGWLRATQPRVHVLTDGGGHARQSRQSRLPLSQRLLESLGAAPASIFGRITDHEAYAAIMDGDLRWIASLTEELAEDLARYKTTHVITDAAEGYNPVHDLCRLLAGAACSLAARNGHQVTQYEFSIARGPHYFQDAHDGTFVHCLDDAQFEQKLGAAHAYPPLLGEMQAALARFGTDAFRRETFQRVPNWKACGWDGDAPSYDRVGYERVGQERYRRVLQYTEHMLPLQTRLQAWVQTQCAS